MSDLNKEYFNNKIDDLLEKVATKDDVNRLAQSVEEQIADLARMTAEGFAEIKGHLDVREEVKDLHKRMSRIEQALNIQS